MGTPVATTQLTFDDEFDTFNGSPNGTTGWETRLPYYGTAARNLAFTDEIEFYSDSSVGANPFSVDNGVLSITASSAATAPNSYKLPYNSGAMTTYKSFSQEYGYTEIRAQMPAGKGLWSAFWMAPTSLDGQSELDVLELLGNNTKQFFGTTHSMVNGVFTPYLQYTTIPDASAGFHTYGIDWEPTTITWYEDGVKLFAAPTPSNMNEQMFTLLNLAVGGPTSWPGAPNSAAEFPANYKLDYIRSYATAATKYVSGTEAIGLGAPSGQGSVMGVVAVGLGAGTPLQGVTVTLLGATGGVLASTTTDAHGDYQFVDLDPGTYQLRMTTPAGYILQGGSTGTVAVTLAAGDADLAAPLKLAIPTAGTTGALTGSVLLAGASGTAGTAGVGVALLNASGGTVATTTTNASGAFSFATVTAGTYKVRYTAPAGEVPQSGPGGTTGLTAAVTVTAGKTTTLAAETLTAAPAGIAGSTLLGAVGQAGVGVNLLSANGVSVVAATTTDASGAFSFTGLAAGTYFLDYTAPSGEVLQSGPGDTGTGVTAPITLAAGQTVTLPAETLTAAPAAIAGSTLLGAVGQAGVGVNLLSANGVSVVAATTTDASGAFSFTGLAAGTYFVDYTAPSGEVLQSGPGDTGTGVTAPITLAAGQTVTLAAETLTAAPTAIAGSTLLGSAGQAGVGVALLDATGTTTLATTTSAANGMFSFTGLAAGTYVLDYTAPSGEALQSGPGNAASGLTAPVTVSAGQTLTLAAETLATLPASIGGGTLLGGVGQAGLGVALLGANGNSVLAGTVTDANGNFSFTGLAAGTYEVKYTAPAGEVLKAGPGNAVTGVTAPITLAAGQTVTLAAETLAASSVPTGAITGSTLFAGAPQAGVAVALLDGSGRTTLATTATNAYGFYGFSGLTPGYYRVQYAPPSGEIIQGGPVNASGQTAAFGVSAGGTRTVGPVGFAPGYSTLTGSVVISTAGAGAVAAAGVAVSVVGASGVVATTSTDANGSFQFNTLVAGTYQVRYAPPAGSVLALGDLVDPSTGLTAPITLTAGGATALSAQDLLTMPGSISAVVVHFGSGDHGTGQSGVGVSLLDGSGNTLATTVTDGGGVFTFGNLAAGTYQVRYTAPDGEALSPHGIADPTSGLTTQVTLRPGFNIWLTHESVVSSSNTFALTGEGATAVRGNGDYVVSGAASDATLTLGNGNQTVSLTGSGDTVTTGTGTSAITVAGGNATIFAAGSATIGVTGGGNVLDTGPGASFLNSDGAGNDTFVLNGAGQGLTTIGGYAVGVGDTLDVGAALAGLGVSADLSNVGNFLTAQVVGSDTILSVTPDGGQTSYAFAQLTGVATSVAQLVANHELANA